MADMSGLKKRVELIDLRLKTAHSARERESAALMEIWEQIRERFLDQNAEIATLRERVSDLEDTRDDLLQMIHGLLAAVEGGLERMSDETVPQIKVLASSLLSDGAEQPPASSDAWGAQPDGFEDQLETPPHFSDNEPKDANFHSDLLNAIERSLEDVDENTPREGPENDITAERSWRRADGTPASPGIRDLIARIEGAVGPELVEISQRTGQDEELDDELTRDLREIEALRGELHGLRERISSGGR